MGASTSRIEEDKALQLCRERKKFVRQALDGRCSLAAAHVSYVQSLKSIGTAVRTFAAPEISVESSIYTSTGANPEPLAFSGKSVSHFSYASPSSSQRHKIFSPSPSPPHPNSSHFQANHMKFIGFSSKKVEEKPPDSVIGTVTSSTTLQAASPSSVGKTEPSPFEEASSMLAQTPPWDYFGLYDPIDNEFSSSHDRKEGKSRMFENGNDFRHLKEEGIPELENKEKSSFHEREDSRDSEDEFYEPSANTLVQNFENFNRVHDNSSPSVSPKSLGGLDEEKNKSPDLSPMAATMPSAVTDTPFGMNKTSVKGDSVENSKALPKDFSSGMKEIESLFIKASESGKEVPRMLEANKLHFRPIFPGKESESSASSLFKACFSCGEDHTHVPDEPAQSSVKYLTWPRTESSRSSSSMNPLGGLNSDDVEELNSNLFDNISLIAGSHASTLDRLYAWERKLYDEVKASQIVRREYDRKCKELRQLESDGIRSYKIDKTRAVVKDLHSGIRVAIHRIDSISRKIEELRDKELQPQLEELIEGLSRMWEVMLECHKLQFRIVSGAYKNGNIKINIQSELHRQITSYLEDELSSLATSFTKWIGAKKSYIESINNWLVKCVSLPQRSSKRKRRFQTPSLRNYGPPIYVTCGDWLEKLDALPTNEVSDSIKALASDVARFLPRQEKNSGKRAGQNHLGENGIDLTVNMLEEEETSEDWVSGFDGFRSSLEKFLGSLSQFAESSVKMYEELQQAIRDAKINYDQWKTYSQS